MHPVSTECTEDSCFARSSPTRLGTLAATASFVLMAIAVAVVADRQWYPLLRGGASGLGDSTGRARRAAFSATLALTVVLAQMILGDLSGLVSAAARDAALAVVVPALLVLLVVAIPLLQLRAVVRGRVLLAGMFAGWLAAFWSVGIVLRAPAAGPAPAAGLADALARACLERVGIIGIALMALLSGFAAVSSPWHTFGDAAANPNRHFLTDADIARKQHAVQVTSDMLAERRLRLQALDRLTAASLAS